MNIEAVREFALALEHVTEDLFAENWITFRVEGKWFLMMQLDAPEPRIAVKLSPERGASLREQYEGVRPAYHMNKIHWNDLYLEQLDASLVQQCITESYSLVVAGLPKVLRKKHSQSIERND